jgi:hypothetical protein
MSVLTNRGVQRGPDPAPDRFTMTKEHPMAHPSRSSSPDRTSSGALNLILGLLALIASGLVVGAAPAQAADSCPNAAIRAAQHSTFLADCRAYEMVTPVKKNISVYAGYTDTTQNTASGFHLSADGSRVVSTVNGAYPGADSAPAFGRVSSRRTADGWITKPVDPPVSTNAYGARTVLTFAVSEDGKRALVQSDRVLAPGGVSGANNVYVRDTETGGYELVVVLPASGGDYWSDLTYGGPTEVSDDLRVVTFASSQQLTPDAPPGRGQYIWHQGQGVSYAAHNPDGTPLPGGALPGANGGAFRRMSPDGKRVLFAGTTGDSYYLDGLYLHDEGHPVVQVSKSHYTGDDPSVVRPARFAAASRDLSTVFFSSFDELTDDTKNRPDHAGPVNQFTDTTMYRYDTDTGELINLLPDVPYNPGLGTRVDQINGPASDDGSAIVWMGNATYAGATGLRDHVYVWHNGTVRYITNNGSRLDLTTAQFSSDGRYLAWTEESDPVARPFDCVGVCRQVYVYDWEKDKIACASCSPPGEAVVGSSVLRAGRPYGMFTTVTTQSNPANVITADGTLIFETSNALVSRDTNGRRDIYTWKDGVAQLITTGTDADDAFIAAITKDGSTVAFGTAGRLVAQDTDDFIDTYVARVDGGLASQNVSPPVAHPCDGDACQGPVTGGPASQPIGSVTFVGKGGAGALQSTLSVTVSRLRSAIGASAMLSVRVPEAGSVALTGSGVTGLRRTVAKAGTVNFRTTLTRSARKALSAKRRYVSNVKVTFKAKTGAVVATTVRVTFTATAAKARVRTSDPHRGGR